MLYNSSVFIIIANVSKLQFCRLKNKFHLPRNQKRSPQILSDSCSHFPQLVLENISYDSYDEFHY